MPSQCEPLMPLCGSSWLVTILVDGSPSSWAVLPSLLHLTGSCWGVLSSSEHIKIHHLNKLALRPGKGDLEPSLGKH